MAAMKAGLSVVRRAYQRAEKSVAWLVEPTVDNLVQLSVALMVGMSAEKKGQMMVVSMVVRLVHLTVE